MRSFLEHGLLFFQMRSHWMKSQKESLRLEEAGLTGDVLDSALSAFILEVVARHGEPSRRLCNKDPFTLKSGTYLKQLFPKSKFLFMVRDGRATVHSIITRKVTITGFDLKSYRQSLTKWNGAITAMNDQCDELGPEYCLKVYYEQLVRNGSSGIGMLCEKLEKILFGCSSLMFFSLLKLISNDHLAVFHNSRICSWFWCFNFIKMSQNLH